MLEEIEIWKDVPNYEGYYQVSSFGNVRSINRIEKGGYGCDRIRKGKDLKFKKNWNGYYNVTLRKNSIRKVHDVHRLVAIVHVPNPENKSQVNHFDGVKTNNRASNLKWCTGAENMQHAHQTGLMRLPIGEDHVLSKLTESDVLFIRNSDLSIKELSDKFNVNFLTVRNILSGKNWKHVGGKIVEFGKRNTMCESDVIEIRRLYSEENLSQKEIAEMFSIRRNSVSMIVTGVKWKNVGGNITKDGVVRGGIRRSKLSEKDKEDIITYYSNKDASMSVLANIYNVTKTTISRVVRLKMVA